MALEHDPEPKVSDSKKLQTFRKDHAAKNSGYSRQQDLSALGGRSASSPRLIWSSTGWASGSRRQISRSVWPLSPATIADLANRTSRVVMENSCSIFVLRSNLMP
jgi:hypothetical protein